MGSTVLLRGFDEMTEVYTQTTTVQENGMYSFENVEMPDGRVFMVTLDYNEAVYGSDIAMVEPGTTSMDLPVTIYETTSDTSAISADRLHLFFEFTEDNRSVRVIQLFILSNTSNKTVVPPGEGQPSVTFSLPEGANIAEVVNALNAIGATPTEMIAILQMLRSAGALQAEVVAL